VTHSAANVHDSKVFLEEAVDAIEPIKRPRGRPGRPRKRPKKLHADKGYDFPRCRKALRRRGIKARIARRGIDSSERLGGHRWVVERTLAWLSKCRAILVRWDKKAANYLGLLKLACALLWSRRYARLAGLR
jgi:transposase